MELLPILVASLPFFVGFLLVAGTLFANGGWAKRNQLRVMSAIFAGEHGASARRRVVVGLLLICASGIACFAVVSAKDAGRAARCRDACSEKGFERGRIGPNSDRDAGDRSTWFVACICEGGGQAPLEWRAE